MKDATQKDGAGAPCPGGCGKDIYRIDEAELRLRYPGELVCRDCFEADRSVRQGGTWRAVRS